MISVNYKSWLQPKVVLFLYAIFTIFITFIHVRKGIHNNYLIFTKPFFNLLVEKNLYLEYPKYYSDTYKYSPAFALFMGPFALLPNWLGSLAWNSLNTAVLYTAGRRLFPQVRHQVVFLLLIISDVATSLHNSQANCLLLGLMLWVYINLENQEYGWAAVCTALAALIKVYGVGIGLLFLFYPKPIRHGLWAVAGSVLLAFTPLLVVSWPALQMEYEQWYLIVRGSETLIQFSIMGVLESWFGVSPAAKPLTQAIGLFLLLIPAAYYRFWTETSYRHLYVSSILLFVVIFNQMAESATFVIPVAGFIFWFIYYRRSFAYSNWLLVLALLFTMLPATDIYPKVIRHQFLDVYKIKVVPMILAWLVIHWQLLLYPRYRQKLDAVRMQEQEKYAVDVEVATR